MMSNKKGIKHKQYSSEYKLKIVSEVLVNHRSSGEIARVENIDSGMIRRWVRQYNKDGVSALQPKDCNKGNHFSALHRSKSLSEIDKLKLTVEKLQIENERLKKGYITKGVGARKVFVTLKDLNSK